MSWRNQPPDGPIYGVRKSTEFCIKLFEFNIACSPHQMFNHVKKQYFAEKLERLEEVIHGKVFHKMAHLGLRLVILRTFTRLIS